MTPVRIALIGCGSVSEHYLAHLKECSFAEIIAVADADIDRAKRRAEEFSVPNAFDGIDTLLDEAAFDFLVNTTAMPSHTPINRAALDAGKHVLCEKPIAGNAEAGIELLELARKRGVRLWGAPNVVTSPQFDELARIVRNGEIGTVYAAHACYGHSGPTWGPWFYRKGGGSLFDLGVYNVTTLTGLLGPAKSVVALSATAIPERIIEGERVVVEADDNLMLLLDHGNGVFSHAQTGFVYGSQNDDRTLELIGTEGAANLLGYDWGPEGVQIRRGHSPWEIRATDARGYVWQSGASDLAECLATGKRTRMTGEHAVHVLDAMDAARRSAETGRRIDLTTTFPFPLVDS